jgi:hypothetical protein
MGGLSFLSPSGWLVALVAVVPLLGLVVVERRARRVRRGLGLADPPRRDAVLLASAIVAVAVLLAAAAAQPVLAHGRSVAARSDAEAWFVVDVSRSMAASLGPNQPTRLERAKALAVRIRDALPEVPAGVASLTDWTLPHLFPSANPAVFAATVRDSLGIENPAPPQASNDQSGVATTLGALSVVPSSGYYSPDVRHRVLIVLSDDESLPFVAASVGNVFRKSPAVHAIFVHVWNARERIYMPDGTTDPDYRPDPGSAHTVAALAAAARGRAFDENQFSAIVAAARADIGAGRMRRVRVDRSRTPIAAWFVLAALVPLAYVLRRRNLTGGLTRRDGRERVGPSSPVGPRVRRTWHLSARSLGPRSES